VQRGQVAVLDCGTAAAAMPHTAAAAKASTVQASQGKSHLLVGLG